MSTDVKSITTAGKKIRYLGSAKSGVGAARAMHVTSLALVPLTIAFVWLLLGLVGQDYAGVRTTLGLAGAGDPDAAVRRHGHLPHETRHAGDHRRLRARASLKDWALVANTFFSAVIGLACLYALLKISFGASPV